MSIQTTYTTVQKLLTRKEIIDIWNKQEPHMLDTYTCPQCRDLLYLKKENTYFCSNCGIYFELDNKEQA